MKRWFLAFAVAAGCGSSEAPVLLEPPEPGLSADPPWLAFTCTRPGCGQTVSATVSVLGTRPIAVRRVLLSNPEHPDFSIELDEQLPLIMGPQDVLPIRVRYAPTGDALAEDPVIRVAYTDASAREADEDRVEPGELSIPLVRRLVGEALLSVETEQVVFGPVPVGEVRTAPLRVRNTGFGNVNLTIAELRLDPPEELSVGPLPGSIGPGEAVSVELSWAPSTERFLRGTAAVWPAGRSAVPAVVALLGTSIQGPSLDLEPASAVDFGEVSVGAEAMAAVQFTNRGTVPLVLRSVELLDVPPRAELELSWQGAQTSTLAPLASATANLRLAALSAGRLDARLRIESSDGAQPSIDLPVIALLARPAVATRPQSLDFGSVPRGWTRTLPVEVENEGFGELILQNVALVLGTSQLFTVPSAPSLPARMRHGERATIEVEFRSEAAASFSGTLALETSDPDRPFVEIPLAARGASCEEGCPVPNGTPDCTAGICAVLACDRGWYDVDDDPSNGCECREPNPGGNPSRFCAEAPFLGSIDDSGQSLSFTGVIHTEDDVDVIRFHARDRTQFLRDDFDVRIELRSADPDIEMCIYRHDTENHRPECVLENRSCGSRTYRRQGRLGREDGADFVLEISRRPGSVPTCINYSVFARNG